MIRRLFERIEITLRRACGGIKPERRVAVIVVLMALFAAADIYIILSAFL